MTGIRTPLTFAIAATVAAGIASAGHAQSTQSDHYVDALKYTNKGAYLSQVSLHWKDTPESKEERILALNLDGSGVDGQTINMRVTDSVTIDLGGELHAGSTKGPAEGAEVWLVVNINRGSVKSCRKSNAKFYYQKGSDNTARFSTAGSTKNNNNCSYDGGG